MPCSSRVSCRAPSRPRPPPRPTAPLPGRHGVRPGGHGPGGRGPARGQAGGGQHPPLRHAAPGLLRAHPVPLDYSSPASPQHPHRLPLAARHGPARRGRSWPSRAAPDTPRPARSRCTGRWPGRCCQARNLLLVDLRGTGNSTPLNCPGLEHAGRRQHGRRFNRLVAACGRQLNHTWRYRGGGWVHASDLFNTAYSARDGRSVLRRCRLGRVDLYGDSYGSWFSQVFASRYPRLLRSVTLDSTYQVLGLDPWYTTTVVTARRAFDQACALVGDRARGRRARPVLGPDLGRWPARLARAPVSGVDHDGGRDPGPGHGDRADPGQPGQQRGLRPGRLPGPGRGRPGPAGPRRRGAAAADRRAVGGLRRHATSRWTGSATACTSPSPAPTTCSCSAGRPGPRSGRGSTRRPCGVSRRRTFAPFSVAQWTAMDQYTEAYSACLDWPAPVHTGPADHPAAAAGAGPAAGADPVRHPRLADPPAGRRDPGGPADGPSARLVTVANLTHVTLQDATTPCPASIYQRFIRDPAAWPPRTSPARAG